MTTDPENNRVPARMPAFLIPGPTSFKDEAERERYEKKDLLLAYLWMGSFCAMIIISALTATCVYLCK